MSEVGFEDDEMFLLSVEEYKKYKDVIPEISSWWWLRSPGRNQNYAANVCSDGSVDYNGDIVCNDFDSVRPALHLKSNLPIGSRIVKYDFPWIVIDEDLAIAEVPIGFAMFNDKTNDYATSYVRKWLQRWKDGRQ